MSDQQAVVRALQDQVRQLERTRDDQLAHIQALEGRLSEPSSKQATIDVSGITLAWNAEQGTCSFAGLPVAMMWVDTTLTGLMAGVKSMVGTKRFQLALQSEGRKSVDEDWKVINGYADFSEGFAAIALIAAVAGWGRWELLSCDAAGQTCRFRVSDSWESRYQKTLGECWGSDMLAGKLAGYCTELFGTNCWADQTGFEAKGDTYDSFTVTPSTRSLESEIENLLQTNEATRADMAVALQTLRHEIDERTKIENELREMQNVLELRVQQRTEELSHSNDLLQQEITEHKQDNAALQSVLLAAPVAIGLLHNRVFTWISERMVEMTGYTKDELLGQSARMLYASDAEFERVGVVKYGQLTSHNAGAVDTIWHCKDGTTLHIHLRSSPVNPADFSEGVTFTALDISDRNRMEQQLRTTQKLDSIGILAGGIAHDFNNYLLSILGNISLAKMGLDEHSPILALLVQSEKASLLAKGLTQQLLTFSKGGQPVTEIIPLDGLIQDCTSFALSGSNVTADFKIADKLPNTKADREQIGQVLQNIVTNASQAMPDGGVVTVTLTAETIDKQALVPLPPDTYLRLAISDQGPGIDEALIDQIFDPYFTTKQGGTGLGLAICYSIIHRHGGHITVDSKPGEGTTFLVYLPTVPHLEAPPSSSPLSPRMGTGSILVMDDELLVLEVTQQMLEALGYTVHTAQDGQTAIQQYRRAMEGGAPFDAVIMDLTVPGGMGGKDALLALKTLDPSVYAIVSSGYSTDPVMSDHQAYGFQDVLPKPYTLEKLSRVLHQVGARQPNSSS